MPLYKLYIERTLFVIADSAPDAEANAREWECADSREVAPDLARATRVKTVGEIPREWRTSCPWGGDRKRTCEEYMK